MHRYEVRSVRALAANKSDPTILQSSREDLFKKRGTHDIGFDGTTSSDRRRLDLFVWAISSDSSTAMYSLCSRLGSMFNLP